MEELRAELERVDANTHQAPLDINMADTVALSVPDLAYSNYGNTPTKMKLNNTGFTVTVSGKFDGDPPTISGGPLDGSYKFSQLHFHWGPNDGEGSEHTFEGRSVPLEMHMVHVNTKYATQEEALLKKDGVVILAFLFTSGPKHAGLDGVARGLGEIVKPHTSFKIAPQSLQSLCAPFQRDYFSYWGSVISPSCSHLIQWLIGRTPMQASADQVAAFRQLLNINEEPLLRNYRDGQPLQGRTIFHLAPGSRDGFSLNCSRELTCAAGEGRPAPGTDVSVLSVEGPCTSLGEAESKGVVAVDAEGADAGEGVPVKTTESGRQVEQTPSGRLVERTPSGHLLEKTPSGRLVEKTPSGRLLERTPSGRMVSPSGHALEKTPSGRFVERTPSGRLLEKTPSGHLVEKTPSGHLVERTPSGRVLEKTPSGRYVERTASGRLPEATPSALEATMTAEPGAEPDVERADLPSVEITPSGHELTRTPSGRMVETTASGHVLEKTPSGRYVERTASGRQMERTLSGQMVELEAAEPKMLDTTPPDARSTGSGAGAGDKPPAGAAAAERRPSRTPSARGMGSRVVSFSNLTGPCKERSANEWPDAPYEGPATGSPVFLDTKDAVRLPCPPLEFLGHFQTGVGLVLTNSGETVEISLLKGKDRPVLQGGPLQGRYILDSAHFHWLPNDDATGGTHTINNARSEIECHLVHIHENYKSKTEAMDHPNGLAVVSVLHQVGGAECDVFMRLCKELPRINELYTQVELPGLDLSYMSAVVKPHEYFMYPGRFFGREDGKALVWIVFPQPIGICCQNVAAFQNLRLSLDFRQHDTFPLAGRPLYAVVREGAGGAGGAGDEELALGEVRRTPSGRVLALRADEWPNAPFASKHDILMAPLDIKTSAVPSIPMPPLEYRGHFAAAEVPVEMRNTGEAIDITWKEGTSVPVPVLAGGPLTDEYIFDSAHFHWAQNADDVGAMHRINGKRCDLEFHLVHYKKSLKTRQDAMFQPDGLAVTSFLIQVGGTENESFGKLADVLGDVKEVDASVDLAFKMDWLQSRAGPHGYFTYPGTLFGADQGINVIWMVYPTPVQICCQQVAGFYKLECLESNRVHPLHELLDRPIFHSINPDNCVS